MRFSPLGVVSAALVRCKVLPQRGEQRSCQRPHGGIGNALALIHSFLFPRHSLSDIRSSCCFSFAPLVVRRLEGRSAFCGFSFVDRLDRFIEFFGRVPPDFPQKVGASLQVRIFSLRLLQFLKEPVLVFHAVLQLRLRPGELRSQRGDVLLVWLSCAFRIFPQGFRGGLQRGDFALQTLLLLKKVCRAFFRAGLPLFGDRGVLLCEQRALFGGVRLSLCRDGCLLHLLQLELHRIEMLRLAAFLSSFQSPVPADFPVKIGLQCDERLAVEQLLGAWPAIEDGHQVEVQMRRRLIQVDDGGDDVLPAVALGKEVRAFKEEGVDVVAALIREERRTCADKEGCHEHGVALHLALGRELFKPTVDERGVAAVRGDEIMVEARALAVDLRVGLGAISFVPLVLALDADDVAPLNFFM